MYRNVTVCIDDEFFKQWCASRWVEGKDVRHLCRHHFMQTRIVDGHILIFDLGLHNQSQKKVNDLGLLRGVPYLLPHATKTLPDGRDTAEQAKTL